MTRTAFRSPGLRVGPWRGSDRVALVTPAPDRALPDDAAVLECCARLAARGVEQVITGALNPSEQRPFIDAGFSEQERLHLLVHDLRTLPHIEFDARLRRARKAERAAVLSIDHLAFDDFWQLDETGLLDAIAATPVSRFRVAVHADTLAGYAVSGRAGDRGYVQRVAVHPAHQGHALGAALVVDGLAWMGRHRCAQALVNTQVGNRKALDLYQNLGFVLQPTGLAVLTRTLRHSGRQT